MKKVLFWVEPNWALGSIHFELTKRLRVYGIDSYVFSWSSTQNVAEWAELYDCVDLIVTLPCAWPVSKDVLSFIKPEKLILVAHARQDLEDIKNFDLDDLSKFRAIACVSPWLHKIAKQLGIKREIKLLSLGINYNFFKNKPSNGLSTIGYAGFYSTKENLVLTNQAKTKRIHIVDKLKQKLPIKIANTYVNSYISMAGFYNSIDALLCCSEEEGAGLPILEAGAAGKLVLSTPVGHWHNKVGVDGSIELPLEEESLIQKVEEIFSFYKDNPKEYRNKCLEIQKHAETYDWDYVIDDWVKLIT